MASFKLNQDNHSVLNKKAVDPKSGHVKSYVASKEVVFKFSDGKFKKIHLPKDRMLVAVAPYMNHT
jgi:hypothetical protein